MEDKILTKSTLLDALRAYTEDPDDDVIRLKKRIEEMLKSSPALLYALNDKELEKNLFDDEGNIDYEGDWSEYFGENSLIRPYIFIPQTQTDVKHYICYQVSTKENVRYDNTKKYMLITFTIFIHGKDIIDSLTGIPRHDLIGSIIREMFAWSGISMSDAVPINNVESITDNNYVVRTLIYEATIPNDLVTTRHNFVTGTSTTFYTNKGKR